MCVRAGRKHRKTRSSPGRLGLGKGVIDHSHVSLTVHVGLSACVFDDLGPPRAYRRNVGDLRKYGPDEEKVVGRGGDNKGRGVG